MMGRQTVDQSQLFYLFNLEEQIPADHLLRRLNPIVTRVLVDLREKLAPFYSDIGRPSIDPELMIRMLIVGYCYGIRFERKLCEEVNPCWSTSASGTTSTTSRSRECVNTRFATNRTGEKKFDSKSTHKIAMGDSDPASAHFA